MQSMSKNKKIIILSFATLGTVVFLVIVGILIFNFGFSSRNLSGTYIYKDDVSAMNVPLFTVVTKARFEKNNITLTVQDPLTSQLTISRTGQYTIKDGEIVVEWKDNPLTGDLQFTFSWFVGKEWRVPFNKINSGTISIDGNEYIKE